MARAGQGEPFVVLRPEKAAEQADKLRTYIEQPVLAGVNVAFSGLDAYEVAPQKLPDLMARRPLVLFGKYRGAPAGKIEITGVNGGGKWRQAVEARPADVRAENAALRWLWARRWVDTLEDERAMGAGKQAEEAITGLGLDYKLLTAFTSFVAVDSQVVNAGGKSENVRQPLPMPEGVSNLAVAESKSVGSLGLMGTGSGGGGYGYGAKAKKTASAPVMEAPPPAPAPASPSPAPPRAHALHRGDAAAARGRDEDEAKPAKDDRGPAIRWTITVGKSESVGNGAPVVAAVRSALSSGRAGCAAALTKGKAMKLRLTIDAKGKVTRVELIGGDRSTEACLRRLLSGLGAGTSAQGAKTGTATGTIELTILAS
jgi:Ca-activated chloride channel family protein